MSLYSIARLLMFVGLLLFAAGGVVYLLARFNIPLGRLPGDIFIQRENFSLAFPWVTMLLVSIVLTVLINIAARLLGK